MYRGIIQRSFYLLLPPPPFIVEKLRWLINKGKKNLDDKIWERKKKLLRSSIFFSLPFSTPHTFGFYLRFCDKKKGEERGREDVGFRPETKDVKPECTCGGKKWAKVSIIRISADDYREKLPGEIFIAMAEERARRMDC